MTAAVRETPCDVQASGAVELYFYGELAPNDHAVVEAHVSRCAQCRGALEELQIIREALASRPIVTMPASGDWAGFMARLEDRVSGDASAPDPRGVTEWSGRRRFHVQAGYLAMAALLALVTMSVVFVSRSRPAPADPARASNTVTPAASQPTQGETDTAVSFAAASEEHFERSKLVVLGLATKDPQQVSSKDWTYERELASDLLNDTRIYRMAAEDRGMNTVAGVMRDLELVLLQTSLTDAADPAALAQIQRLIQKRDLVEKISVVATTGL